MVEEGNQGSTPPPPPPPVPPYRPDIAPPDAAMPPRRGGDIISSAFKIYARNATRLILIVAVVVVPLSVLSFLITYFAFAHPKKATIVGPTTSILVVQPRGGDAVLFALLIAVTLGAIVSSVMQVVILRAAAQATIGDPVDVEASYRWGLRRLGSILLLTIMLVVLITIGFFLLIIPGIILLVRLSVSVPALVVEDARGTKALGRSWRLTKDHFWHVFGIGFLELLIVGLVTGILSSFGGTHVVPRFIFQVIGQVLTAPFAALVTVLLYFDLRARVELLTPDRLRAELATQA